MVDWTIVLSDGPTSGVSSRNGLNDVDLSFHCDLSTQCDSMHNGGGLVQLLRFNWLTTVMVRSGSLIG